MQASADPEGTALADAVDQLVGVVTPPPVARVHAAARPGRRRRFVLKVGVVAACIAAVAAAGLVGGRGGEGVTYAASTTELGGITPPLNVQRALTGYDLPSGYRIGDPVDLLARADLPDGRYIAAVRPRDRRHHCAIDFVGPEGDGLVSACGGPGRPAPFDAGGDQIELSGGAVATYAWLSGRAPRGTASMTLVDELGTIVVPTFDGGPGWDDAQFFIIPLPPDHRRLPKTLVARRADGTVTARHQEQGRP